eukprot:GHVQ01026562.1.p1 GENE.GHVQ01026562.1~~GHVQ01026562.1.p1  ORF type:complete len:324 (+),score=68.96 GHVQ01026562.1:63-974(+)
MTMNNNISLIQTSNSTPHLLLLSSPSHHHSHRTTPICDSSPPHPPTSTTHAPSTYPSSSSSYSPSSCSSIHTHTPLPHSIPPGSLDAFPEHVHKIPLNPTMDSTHNYNTYRWGSISPPVLSSSSSHISGNSRSFKEPLDANLHGSFAPFLPYPASRNVFHENDHPEADRINTQYSNMISDILPETGFSDRPGGGGGITGGGGGLAAGVGLRVDGRSAFGSEWEKLLSYRHGLYDPKEMQELKSEEDIRLSVGEYSDRVNADNCNDGCKYLKIENFRCLQAQQVDSVRKTRQCELFNTFVFVYM